MLKPRPDDPVKGHAFVALRTLPSALNRDHRLPLTPSSRCVLILEDSVLVAMAIEAALADRGYDSIVAGTLAAAHERLGRTVPVAALLDLHLPDGNAVELACSLHARGSKVAICSGSDLLPNTCDFAASFRKPVVAAELVEWVEWVEQATRNDKA